MVLPKLSSAPHYVALEMVDQANISVPNTTFCLKGMWLANKLLLNLGKC